MSADQLGFPVVGALIAGTPLVVTPVADTTFTQLHGLGRAPDIITIKLECIAADLGIAVGEVLHYTFSTAADSGMTIWASHTTLRVTIGATVDIVAPSTFNTGNLTLTSWKLTITGYRVN